MKAELRKVITSRLKRVEKHYNTLMPKLGLNINKFLLFLFSPIQLRNRHPNPQFQFRDLCLDTYRNFGLSVKQAPQIWSIKPSLSALRHKLLEAAALVGRLEDFGKGSCSSLSCDAPLGTTFFTNNTFVADAPQPLNQLSSNATMSALSSFTLMESSIPSISIPTPAPPPRVPVLTPTKTSFGPIFEHTPTHISSSTPHPAYVWIEDRATTFSEFIDSAWRNRRLGVIKGKASEVVKTLDGYSSYIFPFLLVLLGIMLTYSVYSMVAKVRHARTGSSVDAVAVCVEGPDTPPTHRRRKLGPVLLGLIQFLVSSVSVLVARSLRVPRSIRRCIILSIVSLLRRIAYMLPDDQAPANDPSLLPVPTPVTGTASVTIPVPAAPTDNVQPEPSSMTSSPPSSSSRPSASVLPSELEKRYGKAIMVAGTRRSAGQKTKAVNNNTGLGKELD